MPRDGTSGKKMENNRRGGYDRRTGDRSDYGRRNSERNYSDDRNSRFSTEAPKRRPRVIRGKDGELRSAPAAPAAPAYESRFSRDHSSDGDRRSFSSGYERRGSSSYERRGDSSYERRGGSSYERRRPAGGQGRFQERGPQHEGHRGTGFGRPAAERPFSGRPASGRPGAGRPSAGKPERGFGRQRKPKAPAQESGINRMISRKQLEHNDMYSDNDMVNIPVKEEVRLNKFIANSGVCSRREADNYIQAGVVTVNGEVVTELGTKVNIYNDEVRFNGERLRGEEKVYIVMNKPKGFVTTSSDPHADKTVMDLLKGCKARVFPVGRLDKYTTGVLMFTNDGEMAEKLTHPSYDKKKIYQVTLDKELAEDDFDKIKAGIMLTDGEIAADELEYVEDDDHRKIGIEIHSGKNRIVRRIFESLGYEVRGLDRVYFAGLTKKGLKRGQWRFLTQGEENILKMGAYN